MVELRAPEGFKMGVLQGKREDAHGLAAYTSFFKIGEPLFTYNYERRGCIFFRGWFSKEEAPSKKVI